MVDRTIAQPGRDKIRTADLTCVTLPIDAAASDEDHRRHQRLANKYGVALPERAEKKRSPHGQLAREYYVRQMPFAFGGMEDLEGPEAESAVKPFWWPIQNEEWDLDYWTARGFNIFIVKDEGGIRITSIPAYRLLHDRIKERCEPVAVLTSQRALFEGGEFKIYRLRDQSVRTNPPPYMR
jgi:hypothetical protein